jgi:hypothetical protein
LCFLAQATVWKCSQTQLWTSPRLGNFIAASSTEFMIRMRFSPSLARAREAGIIGRFGLLGAFAVGISRMRDRIV